MTLKYWRRRNTKNDEGTTYGKGTSDKVGRKIKVLNLLIDFLFDFKRAVYV
jgi:hypothetical protein